MKIGIFGGSFNPIHVGHCIVANYISQCAGIDEVWLLVSPQNPLKGDEDASYDRHRINMVSLAIGDCQRLKVCDIEFEMPRPSYTIDSLQKLKSTYPEHDFSIIIGTDNWMQFHKWKEWQRIIEDFGVVVYPRPGYPVDGDVLPEQVVLIKAPQVEISSTLIRNGLKLGEDMHFFLPEKVRKYIVDNNLYKEE